jgi:hypothetical protein
MTDSTVNLSVEFVEEKARLKSGLTAKQARVVAVAPI